MHFALEYVTLFFSETENGFGMGEWTAALLRSVSAIPECVAEFEMCFVVSKAFRYPEWPWLGSL